MLFPEICKILIGSHIQIATEREKAIIALRFYFNGR